MCNYKPKYKDKDSKVITEIESSNQYFYLKYDT